MSIRCLLTVVTFLAVGCVAAKQATPLWMVGTVTAMVAVLVFFTVQALTLTDRSKYFAQGFCVGGWIYVGLLVLGFEHTLATTWASQVCYRFVSVEEQPNLTYQGAWFRREGDVIRFSSQTEADQIGVGGGGGMGGGMMGGGMMSGMGGGMGGGGGYGGYGGYGGGYGGYSGTGDIRSGSRPFLTRYARYMHVTHCMWTVVLACVFGTVATCCGRNKD